MFSRHDQACSHTHTHTYTHKLGCQSNKHACVSHVSHVSPMHEMTQSRTQKRTHATTLPAEVKYIMISIFMQEAEQREAFLHCLASRPPNLTTYGTRKICRHGGSTNTHTANGVCVGLPATKSSVRTTATVKDPKQILPLLRQLRTWVTPTCLFHSQPRLSKLMPRYQRK